MDQRAPGRQPAEDGGRHRGKDHRPIEPPGFWSEFKTDPRESIFVLCAGWLAIGWGTETTLGGDADPLTHLAAIGTAAGGALILTSYLLYFRPGPLALPAWQKVPARRRAVFVIRHLWGAVFVFAAVVMLAHWISTR